MENQSLYLSIELRDAPLKLTALVGVGWIVAVDRRRPCRQHVPESSPRNVRHRSAEIDNALRPRPECRRCSGDHFNWPTVGQSERRPNRLAPGVAPAG